MNKLLNKKLWLLDMDGTIFEGDRLFDGSFAFLEAIRKRGNYLFISNNSSKSVNDYVIKLNNMGLEVKKEDFFISTQATILYLKENYPDYLVYAQGTKSFIEQLKEAGIKVTEEVDEKAKIVLVAFDTELSFVKLEKTCRMLRNDVIYLATNPDYVCPVEGGFVPDCGSMCISLEYATGKKPKFIGKPEPLMIEIALKKFNLNKEDCVVVGDRLYTDILSAHNAGVDSICVLSGEAKKEDIDSYPHSPTYIFDSVKDIAKLLV